MKEIQRDAKQSQSEFDKEKALLEQKVSYLELSLKERDDKERDSTSEWRTLKTEMAQEIKQLTVKCENDVKQLNRLLEEEREKAGDLELKLTELTERHEAAETRFSETETELTRQLTEASALVKDF